jgi:hypothetical protein
VYLLDEIKKTAPRFRRRAISLKGAGLETQLHATFRPACGIIISIIIIEIYAIRIGTQFNA